MATYEQLMDAARRADAAGDWAGARRFLELAAPMRSAQSPMPVEDVRRMAGAAIDRAGGLAPSQMAGQMTPSAPQATRPAPQSVMPSPDTRQLPNAVPAPQYARPATPQTTTMDAAPIIVEGPNGEQVEFPAGTPRDVMLRALRQHFGGPGQPAEPPAQRTPEQQRALALAAARRRRAEAQAAQQPSPQAAPTPGVGQRVREFFMGDDDPTTQNLGERIGSTINKAGEALTFGLIGDEASAAAESLLPGVTYDDRLAHYRGQEAILERDNPGLALGAEIGGGVMGALLPGGPAAGFINAGRGFGRVARAGAVGGAAGATYGFAEGEGGLSDRAASGALGGAVGAAGGAGLAAVGQGFLRASRAFARDPALRPAAPDVNELRAGAQALFAEAEALGGTLPGTQFRQAADGIFSTLRREGFDADLHPRLAAVLKRLNGADGDMPFGELAILRRVAQNAAGSTQADERRLGSILIEELDDAVEGLAGSPAQAQAREVWARMRRLDAVEGILDRAAMTDNPANSIRNGFRQLLNNPRRIRGFSEAEQDAIRAVATGEGTRGLRLLSGLLNPGGRTGQAVTAGAVGSALFGGPVGGLALPAVGIGAARVAEALTSRNAGRARDIVAMDPATRAIVEALMRRGNPMAGAAPAMGLLGGVLANQ